MTSFNFRVNYLFKGSFTNEFASLHDFCVHLLDIFIYLIKYFRARHC